MFLRKARAQKASEEVSRKFAPYPVWETPCKGYPPALSVEEAQANLRYLLDNHERRIPVLSAFMREAFAITLSPPNSGDDLKTMLDPLYNWAYETWPQISHGRDTSIDDWLRSDKSGDDIVFSLIADVGLYLGEIICFREPRYVWAIDLSDNEMASFHRPVLIAPQNGQMLSPVIIDTEDVVCSLYRQPNRPSMKLFNHWVECVDVAANKRLPRD